MTLKCIDINFNAQKIEILKLTASYFWFVMVMISPPFFCRLHFSTTYIIFVIMVGSVSYKFVHIQTHIPSLVSPYIHVGSHDFDLDDWDKSHLHTQDHTRLCP